MNHLSKPTMAAVDSRLNPLEAENFYWLARATVGITVEFDPSAGLEICRNLAKEFEHLNFDRDWENAKNLDGSYTDYWQEIDKFIAKRMPEEFKRFGYEVNANEGV